MRTETIIELGICLELKTCLNCGGVFALNQNWLQRRYETGGFWYCPYCGSQWEYIETEITKLRRELADAEKQLCRERAEHDQTKAFLITLKSVNKQLKNRMSKGICPCCHRYFANLHRHMKSKHPEIEDNL